MTGFVILITTVGLLYIAGGIESIQSHWFIGLVKWLLFLGFLYEVVQDASFLYSNSLKEHYSLDLKMLYELTGVNAGALAAFFISIELSHGGVIASAIVGLTAAVVFPGYAAAIYCGSFVGMASTAVFASYGHLMLASLLASFIYVLVLPACRGFGGKLGTIAFSGTLLSLLIIDGSLLSSQIPDRSFGITLIFFSIVGAYLTYLVNVILNHGPVIASALVGLLAGLFFPALYGPEEGKMIALMVFTASFAGMSNRERIGSWFQIVIAGALAALLFIYTQPYAGGAGGKMGTIAFAAAIAVSGADKLIQRVLSTGR